METWSKALVPQTQLLLLLPSQLLRPSWAADNPGGSWQASPSRAGQGVDRLHRQQLC